MLYPGNKKHPSLKKGQTPEKVRHYRFDLTDDIVYHLTLVLQGIFLSAPPKTALEQCDGDTRTIEDGGSSMRSMRTRPWTGWQ